MFKEFLLMAGVSVIVFVLGVFFHNVLSSRLKKEEPVFFVLAVIVAPVGFLIGIIGFLVIFIQGSCSVAP